jgi:hypothetical protein
MPRPNQNDENHILIPRENLQARFSVKEDLTPSKEEVLLIDRDETVEIPDTFEFTYGMEAVLFGLYVLLSQYKFRYYFVDSVGYFPGSLNERIFYIPIRQMKELYRAIGLAPKDGRHFKDEEEIREALRQLLEYRHPIIQKSRSGDFTEDGKLIFNVAVRHENLLDCVRFYRVPEERDFLPRSSMGRLKNLIILFNPHFLNERMIRDFRKLDIDLYRRVEESRKWLAKDEGRRYWRKEQTYLSFAFYLLKQGGKFKKMLSRKTGYVIEREVLKLFEKLGLLERYKQNPKEVRTVIRRMLKIYKDMEYIHGWRLLHTKGRGSSKLRIVINVDKFPHLRYRLFRYHRDRTTRRRRHTHQIVVAPH